MTLAAPWRLLPGDRLDRYALRHFAAPLAAFLATLLAAQLLERLLRLFDLAASVGAPPSRVVVMVVNLVPHYLGLALPMAFMAAIFVAAARLSDDSELDVMLSCGRGMARIAAPYFVLAVLLVPVNLVLLGELQPLTRYGYRLAVHDTLQTGWNARLEANRLVDAGRGLTFGADAIDADGRGLTGVFVARRAPGVEEVTTAARGRFVPGADGRGLLLRLEDGQVLREGGRSEGGRSRPTLYRFDHGSVNHDLAPAGEPFRARGESAREQTLAELRRAMDSDRKAAAEWHGRLARALLPPLLPLFAFPLGMAAKRGQRTPGVVFAALALLALNHALQFGQSLAETGRLPAAAGIWTPYVLFALLGAWIFAGSRAWPGDNPVLRAVQGIDRFLSGLRPRAAPSAPRPS